MDTTMKNETAFWPVDPVCAMTVDPSQAESQAQFNGHTYYFCSPACHQKFLANPSGFVSRRPALPVDSGAHALIDPLCGMRFDPARALHREEPGISGDGETGGTQ